MISLSEANFLGFIFESFFYGVFLIIFAISVNLQWSRYRHESLTFGNKLIFAFSILLCLFITTHWWLNLWGIYMAFFETPDSTARELFFANSGTKLNVARFTVYEVQTWMGDLLLTYRLYHVAGRKLLVVIPPLVTSCCLIICSAHFLYYASRLDLNDSLTLPGSLSLIRKWSIATCALTVGENFYCLGLITFFIWGTHRRVHRATSSNLQSVLRIFIESAGMWVLGILVTFIVYLFNEPAYFISLYLTNPVLGISFCMMTVRLQLRDNGTAVGSGSGKPTYLSNLRFTSKEQPGDKNSSTIGSTNTQNSLIVFSSEYPVDDSTFDPITSKV